MLLLQAHSIKSLAMLPLLGAIESFLIFLLLAVGSAVFNWLKERGKNPEGLAAPAGRGDRDNREKNWERRMDRTLGQEHPTQQPVHTHRSDRPASPPVPTAAPLPKEHWQKKLQEVLQQERNKRSTSPGQVPPSLPVPALAAADGSYENASHLDQQVGLHMEQLTRHPVQMTHAQTRMERTQSATQALALVRSPQGLRQAMLASIILAPPRSLE